MENINIPKWVASWCSSPPPTERWPRLELAKCDQPTQLLLGPIWRNPPKPGSTRSPMGSRRIGASPSNTASSTSCLKVIGSFDRVRFESTAVTSKKSCQLTYLNKRSQHPNNSPGIERHLFAGYYSAQHSAWHGRFLKSRQGVTESTHDVLK